MHLFRSSIRVALSILDLALAAGFFYGGYRWFRDISRGVNGITMAMLVLYAGLGLRSLRLAVQPLLAGSESFSFGWHFINQVTILLSFYLINREDDNA